MKDKHLVENIPAGASLQEFLRAFQLRHHLEAPATARAWGRLMNATVSRGPHGPAVAVTEQSFLVGCDIAFNDDGFMALGTVSWRDGLIAGQINEALSAGVTIELFPNTTEEHNAKPVLADGGGWSAAVAASETKTADGPQEDADEPQPSGWGAAVAASASPPPTSTELSLDEVVSRLRRGDIVIHPRFGDCTIVKPCQGGKIKIRRSVGGFLDLQLRVFKIRQEADRDSRQVFALEINKG